MYNLGTTDWVVHRFNRNDTIQLRSDMLWLLKRGNVKTLTWDDDGNVVTLGYWGSGDVVGQPLSRINPYEIKCLTAVEASCIPWQQLNRLSDAIQQYIQQTEILLNIIHCERIHHRLHKILVWLAQRFGRAVEQGYLIDLPLTHRELAEVTGTTRVTVTRLLKQFEQEGLIYRPHRHGIILRSQLTDLKINHN
jgi:CRP-like cAMP-binding protein